MSSVKEIHRILFIRTDRLGETLLNLPAVAALKAACPNASLTVLAHPDLQPLLATISMIDRIMVWRRTTRGFWGVRAFRLSRELAPHRFDLAVVSNPTTEAHVAVWMAGIPIRVGYGRKWGRLLSHRVPDRKSLGERHEVEYNLDLVRCALGLPVPVPLWRWPRFERELDGVLQLLGQQGIEPSKPLIAVHPWSSNPIKRWPPDRYQMLIRYAVERLAAQVVVIGGPEEAAHAPTALPAGLPVANLVGRLTLVQLAALLQHARLLISNDSGPVHLAAAVGTPTVVLFGSAHAATGPRRWGPWGTGHTVIWKPSMEAIAVEEVCTAVRDLYGHANA